jgi:hypothetical protein
LTIYGINRGAHGIFTGSKIGCAEADATGVQARSRYRMVLLSLMSVAFGLGAFEMLNAPTATRLALSGIGVSGLAALMWFAKSRREISDWVSNSRR